LDDLSGVLDGEGPFVLVDEDQWGLDAVGERRPIPFPERDGEWAGYPPHDAAAVAELRRLRSAGADFIVFPARMAYWLDAYPGLRSVLRSESRCVVDNGRALVYDLR
jgi:hypothetical protein